MNDNKKREKEILDLLEKLLVSYTKTAMKQIGHEVDEKQARAVLGNIGSRILFGSEIADDIIMKRI